MAGFGTTRKRLGSNFQCPTRDTGYIKQVIRTFQTELHETDIETTVLCCTLQITMQSMMKIKQMLSV